MLLLRVRCVDDGRELLLERHGANEHSIRVADLKELILQHRHQLSSSEIAATSFRLQLADLENSFVLLRGHILADPDIVDLNALLPTDFFVFVADNVQTGNQSISRCEMHKNQADPAIFELQRAQLVEMGFSADLAAQALHECGCNLSDAAALLAEGNLCKGTKDMNSQVTTNLGSQYPFSLRSLVHDGDLMKLRKLAAVDSFRALLFLKETFSSEALDQLNENSMATLQLLLLPVPAPSLRAIHTSSDDASNVDVLKASDSTSNPTTNAIDRLVAMGFARDLVEVMYENCNSDEMLTANALLQTLES
ncbi:putative UBA-like superfamily, Ubiquitin-associated domain-containing protein [Plasmopara halstedii]